MRKLLIVAGLVSILLPSTARTQQVYVPPSFALLGNVPANSVLGNNTGTPSTVIGLSSSQVLDMVGSAPGGILYRGAGTWGQSASLTGFVIGNGSSAPTATSLTGLVIGNGASAPTAYAGGTCTNQALTVLSASGVPTCSSITNSYFSGLLGLSHGGVNLDLTGTGGASQFLKQNTLGGQPSFVRPACADLSNAVASCSTDTTSATNITSGTLPVARLSLSQITTSLGSSVSLNNTANFFDGPSIAQGATGTWYATGSVSLLDTAAGASFNAKLWDGTTVIASGRCSTSAANGYCSISLSGFLATPAANIKISVQDVTATTGSIAFNGSGASKDGTVSAFRIQ